MQFQLLKMSGSIAIPAGVPPGRRGRRRRLGLGRRGLGRAGADAGGRRRGGGPAAARPGGLAADEAPQHVAGARIKGGDKNLDPVFR